MKNIALILIDIQNIYFTEGEYKLYKPEIATRQAKTILDEFRKRGLPIIHVKHEFGSDNYKQDHDYLNNIHEMVAPFVNEKIITKQFPSAFLQTDLLAYLESIGITDIVIVGMMSHMCVNTTARACQNYGYQVTVIEDACTTKALAWKGQEIDAITNHHVHMAGINGVFANVVCVEEYLTQLE